MTLLILYVLLALGVSFLCSVLEAVLLSVSPSYVAALQQQGDKVGERLEKLKRDIDRPLASILSLNTIAHTVGAAGAGAQAQVVFGDALIAVFSAVLTLAILIFSEIIPKTLGASYWRGLAPWATRILIPMIWLMYPFVLLSKALTRIISPKKQAHTVSREEFSALADIGTREGVFEEEESRILRNLLRFKSLRVKDIMTPRTVVLASPEDRSVEEFFDKRPNPRFSRIPIYGENRDDITGYVLKHDLLLELANDRGDSKLGDLRREVLVVPELLSLRELFERLIETQEHLALVVDEYGGMAGIVTMEDLVETLLGLEIVDEVDLIQDMQVLARHQWYNRAKRLGLVTEDDTADDLGIDLPSRPGAESPDSSSSPDKGAEPPPSE
ncbi:HlyC/CorC family transporter [Persicimonas caeni]|uniref:HlyC/CorC family transporter n=1 Tax=Persicimonas caeni TaxID=2292766 RepID=A0A4Y6PVT2_PERCE|nr:hemolysin family protein [Persicimonas caeni]QDG51845.1 HlyC/CorC family transporter [Persicimonas caeni]QED33066.1 HlyC/CorC family transporter [Persicimonas caeni]